MADTTLRKEFERAIKAEKDPTPLTAVLYSTNDAVLDAEFDNNNECQSCDRSLMKAWSNHFVYIVVSSDRGARIVSASRNPVAGQLTEHQHLTLDDLTPNF